MDAIPNGPRKKILQGSFDLVLKLPWNEAAGAPWSLLVFAKKKVVLKTLFFLFKVTTLFTLGTWVERCTVSEEDW